MFYSDMPHFNGELLRWLIAYKIEKEKGILLEAYKEVINFAKIDATKFMDIINEMIINGYLIKNVKPIYDLKSGSSKICEVVRYDRFYLLTKKGAKQLCLGWEFASSAIPKELYDEIAVKIPFIEK